MIRLNALIGGLLAALALAADAQAADMPDTWLPPLERPRGGEYLSGWYLRGDIGYRYNRIGSVDTPTPLTGESYANALGVSAGVGYKYQWFRSDLTVDHGAPANFNGTTATAATQPQYVSKLDSFSVLANVYLDLGTWWGFTPYIGAGGGASYLRSTDYGDTTLPAGLGVPTTAAWTPSWAAMAGVSYQVLPNWVIDVGYRYLYLGSLNNGVDPNGHITSWKTLSAQEVRIGFRLLLD